MRALAVLAFLEGAGGVAMTIRQWRSLPVPQMQAILLHLQVTPSMQALARYMMAVNLAFGLLLAGYAVPLWHLKKGALATLASTLAAEALYVLALWLLWTRPLHYSGYAATVFGNPGLFLQALTGFPLFAPVLISLAYRRLRAPAARGSGEAPQHGEGTPRPTRGLKVVMRLLAGTALLEGAMGLYEERLSERALRLAVRLPGPGGAVSLLRAHPAALKLAYAIMTADTLCSGLLLVSAVFLWRLKRTGLALLAWTLGAEVAFVVVFVLAPILGRRAGIWRGWGPMIAVPISLGIGGIVTQALTWYPLIAGILIFLAYRYLGTPPREPS